ncbi:hypothetical protein ACWC9R_10335 [Streptomyces sp. NPDC001219]
MDLPDPDLIEWVLSAQAEVNRPLLPRRPRTTSTLRASGGEPSQGLSA